MNLEKLTCCLAKPMNAIRDLVSKINEIILGHNELVEKVNNLPEGGGGGSGGGTSVLRVKFTIVLETIQENDSGGYFANATADIPFVTCYESAMNGAVVQGVESVFISDGEGDAFLPLVLLQEDIMVFSLYLNNLTITFELTPDNTVKFNCYV